MTVGTHDRRQRPAGNNAISSPLPQNVLVVRIDGIGDLLCITPMLRRLRVALPTARIDVVANQDVHEALRGNPDVDRIFIDYRTRSRGSRLRGLRHWPARVGNLWRWRFGGYQLVIVAHYGFHRRALRIADFTRAARILRCVEDEFAGGAGVNVVEVRYQAGLHEVRGVFGLLSPLGITDDPGPIKLAVPPDEAAYVQRQLAATGSRRSSPRVVGLNLTASVRERYWPWERFRELMRDIGRRFPGTVFALIVRKGAEEGGFSDDVKMSRAQGLDVIVVETPRLGTLFAAIDACDVFVSSDGGAVHMAAALNVPVVALFQNRDDKIKRWYPWQVKHRLIHAARAGAAVGEISLAPVRVALVELMNDIDRNRTDA